MRDGRCAGAFLLALSACSPAAPPPLPPPTVVVTAAPAEPLAPAVITAAPVEPKPPPPMPGAPFSIVASADGDHDFAVFPLEDGAAILAAAVAGNMGGTLKLAVLDRDEIAPAPSLPTGLPAAVFSDAELPLVAGRWPDALWLARGPRCEAHQWQPKQGRWEPRPPKRPPDGKCTHLAAWTPGAAVASIQGPKGPSLAAFGAVPRAVPLLPARRPGQPKDCGMLLGAVNNLFAFPTGEVLSVGPACDVQRNWLVHWASGGARGDVIDAEIDPNAPFFVRRHTRDEIVIDGAGVIDPAGGEIALEVRFLAAGGRLRRASIEEHEVNALERWMYQAREILGLPEGDPTDGFLYDNFALTPTDDVFVVGHLMRMGRPAAALVLRSRPVKKVLELR